MSFLYFFSTPIARHRKPLDSLLVRSSRAGFRPELNRSSSKLNTVYSERLPNPVPCGWALGLGNHADLLLSGTHEIETGVLPILSNLAGILFGGQVPVRCEIWFFSGNIFTARRWGTPQPIMVHFNEMGLVPIRAFGNYNVVTEDPKRLFDKLIGSRSSYSITDLEDFIQGHLLELLPQALEVVKNIRELSRLQDAVSKKLEALLDVALAEYGITVHNIQILSLLPSAEVIKATDERVAMDVIGNKQEYLMYKAANSLDAVSDGGANDPMQMMLGMMLGKGLMTTDYHDKEPRKLSSSKKEGAQCSECNEQMQKGDLFCSHCGEKMAA